VRGGTIERVYVRDFTVKVVGRAAIDVDLFYEEGKNGTFLPTVRDICVERMIVHKCAVAFNLVGYTERPIQDVLLKDCTFSEAAAGYTVTDVAGFQAENTTVNGRAVQLNEIETTK
jgi:hypothetical protein